MPLIRRGIVSLALKHMTQMAATVPTHDLCSGHSKRVVGVALHGAWNTVKVRRPPAAGLELVVCFVERSVAARTGVDAVIRVVLIKFPGSRWFSTFLTEDAELIYLHVRGWVLR